MLSIRDVPSRAPARLRAGGDWRRPLSDTLGVLAPFVPAALVPGASWEAAREVAERLPAALTDELYLECRLAAGDDRVDLVLHLHGEGRAVAAGGGAGAGLSPDLLRHAAWRRLRDFCAEWALPRSALHRSVCALWVEIDVDGPGAGDAPGVFLDLHWLAERGAATDEVCTLAGAWLAWLAGTPPRAAALWSLRRSLDALPRTARPAYVGLFPGRGAAVRFCAKDVASTDLPAFLEAAGWEGDGRDARARVEALAGGESRGIVHLDLEDGVGARLGVELPRERRAQLAGPPRPDPLAARLVDAGLACPDKAAALALWPGWSEEVMPHQPWASVLARRVNHVKLVAEAGREPHAKAYLWARHAHRRRA